jgi:hypothetical protein
VRGSRALILRSCRRGKMPLMVLQLSLRYSRPVLPNLTVLIYFGKTYIIASFEAFTAVVVSSRGLWAVTQCSVVVGYQRSEVHAASIFRAKWRWRQHGPLKRWYPTATLHWVTTPEDIDVKLNTDWNQIIAQIPNQNFATSFLGYYT